MQSNIIKSFCGNINGVLIEHEEIFYVISDILLLIEEKYGEKYNTLFVTELSSYLSHMYFKEFSIEYFFEEFKNEFIKSKDFIDIKCDSIVDFNENMKNGKYLK